MHEYLTTGVAGQTIQLAAYPENAPAGAACFLQGQLRDSWLAARGLTILAKVITARFAHKALRYAPPIVTAGAGQLRFEAFSPCKGVYARFDLGPAARTASLDTAACTTGAC